MKRLEVGGFELRQPDLGVWLELVPLLADQGRFQLDEGRTRPKEIDGHWALRQRLLPEQLAYKESDDAQCCNGGATMGNEQSQTRPGGAHCIRSGSSIADQPPLG